MKKIILALFLITFTSVVIAEVATKKSTVDILIERVMGVYEKSVKDADDYYEKYTAPVQKRRDGKIVAAGDRAIKTLNSARRSVSEIDGIKLEQQIAVVRKSLDDKVGDIPTVTRKASVLAVCGVKFKGHTYLAIAAKVNWKEAKSLCEKMGGHLVYVETSDEMTFLAKTYTSLELWVGATDEHKEGDWRWLNNKPVNGKLWGPKEPSNDKNKEHYAFYKKGLCDHPFNWNKGFICEWEN